MNEKVKEESKIESKKLDSAEKPVEKKEESKEKTSVKEQPKPKKTEAVASSYDLPLSNKHSMYICNFIRNKTVDTAIKQLQEVLTYKRAIPFKGEIPHRKGDMMSGRYPVKATDKFITILKGLRGNIIVNGLDVEKAKITWASSSWARRPPRKGGTRFKRVHVILKATEPMAKGKNK